MGFLNHQIRREPQVQIAIIGGDEPNSGRGIRELPRRLKTLWILVAENWPQELATIFAVRFGVLPSLYISVGETSRHLFHQP